MKKIIAWLLACVLLLPACPAMALDDSEIRERVNNYLTEIYGYTALEAEAFVMRVAQAGGETVVEFYPPDHPEWRYTARYDAQKQRLADAATPFYTNGQYHAYPGEGAVRMVLAEAREQGWFAKWDGQARDVLVNTMAFNGISPTSKLRETAPEKPAEALHEFFVSCYGSPNNWTRELTKWFEAELESYGLTFTDEPALTENIAVWQAQPSSGQALELTRFIGEVPQELETVFTHPKLEGWTCLCGALMRGVKNDYGFGLAAFEKEDQRLLVALKREVDSGVWDLSPVSTTALYTDKEMYITPTGDSVRDAEIVYQLSETESERFGVTLVSRTDGFADVRINTYRRMDEASGNGLWMDLEAGIKLIVYRSHSRTDVQHLPGIARTMSMMDINDFPTAPEAAAQAHRQMIPEGYALVSGVHLRQRTSSRSKDLGEYNGGVLAKVLGIEAGDPDPWYRVQVGRAEGYMSSVYVSESSDTVESYALNAALPLAQAQKEITLRSRAGWLSTAVWKAPEGTVMHVLAKCDGGWLHVSVPREPNSLQMDVQGVDGYIRARDVRIARTLLELEWME